MLNSERILIGGASFLAWCAVILALSTNFSFNVITDLLVFLSSFIAVLVFLGCLFSSKLRIYSYYSFIAFLALQSANYISNCITDQQIDSAISLGTPIVEAIEKFHATTGSYPETLEALIPSYLQNIPKTKVGFKTSDFKFLSRPDSFTLYIEMPAWHVCYYEPQYERWIRQW
jgi:hypothetical protein